MSPWELVSQVTVSLLIDGAQVLCKSSACSYLLRHLSSPIFFHLITVYGSPVKTEALWPGELARGLRMIVVLLGPSFES